MMDRIIIRWDRDRPCRLVHRGSEVSEVQWLDNGVHQCIANEHIIEEHRDQD
jgi:hypothetical protein